MSNEQYEAGPFFYITETDKALCVAVDDDEANPEIWLPLWWNGETVSFRRKGVKVWIYAPEDLLQDKGLV